MSRVGVSKEGGAGGMSPRKILAGGHWLQSQRGRGPAEIVASDLPLPISPLRGCGLGRSPVGVGRGLALRGRVGDDPVINIAKTMMGKRRVTPDLPIPYVVAIDLLISLFDGRLNRIQNRLYIHRQIFISTYRETISIHSHRAVTNDRHATRG